VFFDRFSDGGSRVSQIVTSRRSEKVERLLEPLPLSQSRIASFLEHHRAKIAPTFEAVI